MELIQLVATIQIYLSPAIDRGVPKVISTKNSTIPTIRLKSMKNQYSDLDALPCRVNDFCIHPLTESAKDIMCAGRPAEVLSIMHCH